VWVHGDGLAGKLAPAVRPAAIIITHHHRRPFLLSRAIPRPSPPSPQSKKISRPAKRPKPAWPPTLSLHAGHLIHHDSRHSGSKTSLQGSSLPPFFSPHQICEPPSPPLSLEPGSLIATGCTTLSRRHTRLDGCSRITHVHWTEPYQGRTLCRTILCTPPGDAYDVSELITLIQRLSITATMLHAPLHTHPITTA
jgi:hypothetical protein